jgi:hypothetical protein
MLALYLLIYFTTILTHFCNCVLQKLLDRAEEVQQLRMQVSQPKTKREKEVHSILGLMETNMMTIPEDRWMDFTCDVMLFIRGYQQSLSTPGRTSTQTTPGQTQPGVQQVGPDQPQMQAAFHPPPTPMQEYYMQQASPQVQMQNRQPLQTTPPTMAPPSPFPTLRFPSTSQQQQPCFGTLATQSFYSGVSSPGYSPIGTPQCDPLLNRPSTSTTQSSIQSSSGQGQGDKNGQRSSTALSEVIRDTFTDFS